jgi:hypothetical protein
MEVTVFDARPDEGGDPLLRHVHAVDEAKRLLGQGGWTQTWSEGIRMCKGQALMRAYGIMIEEYEGLRLVPILPLVAAVIEIETRHVYSTNGDAEALVAFNDDTETTLTRVRAVLDRTRNILVHGAPHGLEPAMRMRIETALASLRTAAVAA